MPHVAGHDNEAAEYADHEVQVLYLRTFIDGDAGNNEEKDVVAQFEPVSDRGLDSDELAELVGWHRQFAVTADSEQENTQTELGYAAGEQGLGINLTEGEFAEQSGQGEFGAREIDGDSPISGDIKANNYAEPGVLDAVGPVNVAAGAAPTTDQNISTGSGSIEQQREMFYPQKTGSGPYVDRTDDMTIHQEAIKDNLTGRAYVEGYYTLYWNVQEMPEGRASFARP